MLNEGIYGNLGGIVNNVFYDYVYFGIKDLIFDYLREVEKVFFYLVDVDDDVILFEECLDFFRCVSYCYGRLVFMLSGVGLFVLFYIGVLCVLYKEGLLFSVIFGVSGGVFMVGIIGIWLFEELDSMFSVNELFNVVMINYDKEDVGMMLILMLIGYLVCMVENLILDLIFEEVFEELGIYINIFVVLM